MEVEKVPIDTDSGAVSLKQHSWGKTFMESRHNQPVRVSALILLLILEGYLGASAVAAMEAEPMPMTPTPTTAPPRIQNTPTPSATPTPYPRDTYCDIIFYCELFAYDAQQGPAVPIQDASVEIFDNCGYGLWTTDSTGWCEIIYADSNFDVQLRVSAQGYYRRTIDASSSDCPLHVGLTPRYPIPTPTPIYYHDGDCNLDGILTSEDAQLAFSIALSIYVPNDQQRYAADCNGNGDVTAEDAQLIFGAVLGMASCQDAIVTPTPTPNRNAESPK